MILVDTTPLVALCDPGDAYHAIAKRQLSQIAAQSLATCEAVVVEACFHLRSDHHRRRLRTIVEGLDLTLEPAVAGGDWLPQIMDWLERYAEHRPDWAHAALAVLCGRDHRLSVWTFDREFHTLWRRPDGSRIPLAVAPTS